MKSKSFLCVAVVALIGLGSGCSSEYKWTEQECDQYIQQSIGNVFNNGKLTDSEKKNQEYLRKKYEKYCN